MRVHNTNSAADVWREIQNIRMPTYTGLVLTTSAQLNTIRFQSNTESPQEFVKRLDELVLKCANYGIDTSPNTKYKI